MVITINPSMNQSDMKDAWQFQLRVRVSNELAPLLRGDPSGRAHLQLHDVLCRHTASLKCQYDAFADYVREAERLGTDQFPLYQWTKDTIENPEKKTKYLRSFTVSVGGQELYSSQIAEILESELSELIDDTSIETVTKYDTNPANNPQPPARKP